MDEENKNESPIYTKVPAKVTQWSSFKSFMFHEIKLELTPYEKNVFKEVNNFWNQEIYFDKGFHLRKSTMEFEEEPIVNEDETEIKISL